MRNFKKILIANRGEIAIRIARTCKRLGIKTVGIFSHQDRKSLHLDYCDEVYSLGEGTIAETYLNVPKIIDIIKKSNSEAVHPGYGFLSERAYFAKAIEDVGATFIGPQASIIESMGDKIEAKKIMQKLGVPMLPGTQEGVKDYYEAKEACLKIGYPVLLKAAAGGGGKGMRIVHKEEDLKNLLEQASREAKSYFGDGTVYIEKYLTNPHHVEVQVLGDGLGGGGHVFDRECSIQRRHQKLVEESPAPLFLRQTKSKQKILEIASNVVELLKYKNAGTLEFLADDDGGFYFLEMNTRLQVEHPVTEWVTGLDLVEWQIRVAQGEELKSGPLCETQKGHSIEVRLYAETPFDYLPCAGVVHKVNLPNGPFIRVDSSIYDGYEVLTDYDPTLMKLSVWGTNREEAVLRLRTAIDELRVLGVGSNQGLFYAITREEDFIKGNYGTPYLQIKANILKDIYNQKLQELLPKIGYGVLEVFSQNNFNENFKSNKNSLTTWELYARNLSRRY
jgi:acetyl-CoA carboxylase biotin carboxylase subunit